MEYEIYTNGFATARRGTIRVAHYVETGRQPICGKTMKEPVKINSKTWDYMPYVLCKSCQKQTKH